MKTIPEKDWKILKGIKDRLLHMACERAIDRVSRIIKKSKGRAHDAYLEIWSTLKDEDIKIGRMFDDLRRSNAIMKITEMVRAGIMSSNELEAFTEETKSIIKAIISANKSL